MSSEKSTHDLAPILVSVYDRRWHLEQCIEALKRNDLAKDSILYVVSDGSAKPEHDAAVAEVREFINQITGFMEVRPILREKNLGMLGSIVGALELVLGMHGRSICMEDDIVCSRSYLEYMNNCLNAYADDRRIFAVSAYSFPDFQIPKCYPHQVYLWSRFCPWGYAIWSDRWESVNLDVSVYSSLISDKAAVKRFYKITPDSGLIEDDRLGRVHAGDMRLCVHMFLSDLYVVYPVKSLTRNIGLDGSGVHCGKSRKFQNQTVCEDALCPCKGLQPNRTIYRRLYWCRFSFLIHVVGRVLRRLGVYEVIYGLYRKARGLERIGG